MIVPDFALSPILFRLLGITADLIFRQRSRVQCYTSKFSISINPFGLDDSSFLEFVTHSLFHT